MECGIKPVYPRSSLSDESLAAEAYRVFRSRLSHLKDDGRDGDREGPFGIGDDDDDDDDEEEEEEDDDDDDDDGKDQGEDQGEDEDEDEEAEETAEEDDDEEEEEEPMAHASTDDIPLAEMGPGAD
jgi:hypothetical protein